MIKPLIVIAMFAALLLPITTSHATPFTSGISIEISEKAVVAGETITVNGLVDRVDSGYNHLLVMRVIAPDQSVSRYEEIEVNRNDGFFQWSFTLQSGSGIQPGEWLVKARYAADETEISFRVLETGLYDKVIASSPIIINSLGYKMEQNQIKPGQNIAFAADLVNDEDSQQPFVFIVQLVNAETGNVELVSWSLGSLQPYQSSRPMVSWLPETAGSYIVEVLVWTSFAEPASLAEKQTMALVIA